MRRTVSVFVALGGLLTLGGCAAPVLESVCTTQARPTAPRVWVLRTGWHTGLALSRRDLGSRLRHLLKIPHGARSVVFGWGDLRWYAEGEDGIGSALGALLPSRSVLWVEACRHDPKRCLDSGTHWRVLPLDPKGLQGLDRFLYRALRLTRPGRPRPVGPSSPWGEFLRARAPYDAFHTCNTWTAEALENAGLPVRSGGILFAAQLWSELPRLRCRPPPNTKTREGASRDDTKHRP